MTIEEFIEARLAEDERAAAAASVEYEGETWTAAGDSVNTITVSNIAATVEKTYSQGVAEHIARHDPARVLRQVAMVRAMMRHAEEAGSLDMTVENDRAVGPRTLPYIDDLMHRDIASIWSDHPDYRQEWVG